MNPGRPASTGPKPVPFGLSGTPAKEQFRGINNLKYTYYTNFSINIKEFKFICFTIIKNALAGIRTRVFGSKGRNDWPDYTTGA